ncbi:MAG: hypothetical protein LC775_00615 [Acidobacteria bacterium]|nr:hypothetical protein [Acidobacteriota bacterium]
MMTVQVIALIVGAVFILIAVIGGNVTVQVLKVPPVPKAGRIGSGVVGALFICYSVLITLPGVSGPNASGGSGEPPAESSSNAPPSGRRDVIHVDEAAVTSPDGIRVEKVTALSQNDPPQVDDRITILFSLRNVGREPVTLNSIFIGARDPIDNNVDFGHENYDTVLAPDQIVNIENSLIVTEKGVWKFWPCYVIGSTYCPDEWRAFQVLVVKR